MTDGDSTGDRTGDILPTDNAPEKEEVDDVPEGEGIESDADTGTDGDSFGRTADILPTDNAPEEPDEAADSDGAADSDEAADSDGAASDTDAEIEAAEADDAVDDDSAEAGDAPEEPAFDAHEGIDDEIETGTGAAEVETLDESADEVEIIDEAGEVVVEKETATESSASGSKGLAELDRELEELTSDTDRGESDTGGSVAETPDEPSEWGVTDERYCHECGNSISLNAEICPACGVRQSSDSSDDADPGIAALLSFLVPGLGDLYSGETGLGTLVLLAWIAWIGIGWILIGGGFTLLTFGFGLIFIVPVLLFIELLIHVGAAVISYFAAS